MELPRLKIQRSYSLWGLLILGGYTVLACIAAKYLLPQQWRRLDALGAVFILSIALTQQFYWSINFRKGVKQLKQNNWIAANEQFEAVYHYFKKNSWLDTFRFWLLISVAASGYQAMALRNMAFCQLMMKNKVQAKFYYEDLLQLPNGNIIAVPLAKYFL